MTARLIGVACVSDLMASLKRLCWKRLWRHKDEECVASGHLSQQFVEPSLYHLEAREPYHLVYAVLGQAALLVLNKRNQRVNDNGPPGFADAGHLIDETLAAASGQQDGAVPPFHNLHEGLKLTLPKALLREHGLKDFRQRRFLVLGVHDGEVGPGRWLEEVITDHDRPDGRSGRRSQASCRWSVRACRRPCGGAQDGMTKWSSVSCGSQARGGASVRGANRVQPPVVLSRTSSGIIDGPQRRSMALKRRM